MRSHPEGATDAMQGSMTEPMLSSTGNASATQRLLEGQADPTAAAKTSTKPEAWVQAGKNLLQRVAVAGQADISQCLCWSLS